MEIETIVCGRGNNALIYLPGLACPGDIFLHDAAIDIRRRFRVTGFNYPGTGASIAHHPPDCEQVAAEITKMLVKLNISEYVLTTHSMGHYIGDLLHRKNAGRVIGWISVEGNLAPEDCIFSRQIVDQGRSRFRRHGVKALQRRLKTSTNPGMRRYGALISATDPDDIFGYCPTLVEISRTGALLQRFMELDVPRLFIHGSDNQLSYLGDLRRAGIDVFEVPEANHFPFIDNAPAFFRKVTDFLSKSSDHRGGS